jgi:hypothetical protein
VAESYSDSDAFTYSNAFANGDALADRDAFTDTINLRNLQALDYTHPLAGRIALA